MNLTVKFEETSKTFDMSFGAVQNVSDSSYERGYEAGYEDGESIMTALIDRTLTTYSNKKIETIGTNAFSMCAELKTVDLPEVTTIGRKGFNSCGKLIRVDFPKLTTIIPGDNFTYCYALEYVDLGFAGNIPSWCLANCQMLKTLILRKADTVCILQTANAISNTPIASGTGFVYVPDNLVDAYKTATNWSTYASQIKPISEYKEE